MSDYNKKVMAEFRANNGVVEGFGDSLLLLHTVGAKSGETHVTPVRHFIDDDRYVIIASRAGADVHPDWYHNLVANPDVTVEVGTETFEATATVTDEPERTKLYEKMEALASAFTDYKNKTSRVIPVVTLQRK